MVEPDRLQRLHLACWITKDAGAHSPYVIVIAFPRTRFSVALMCIACLVSGYRLFSVR